MSRDVLGDIRASLRGQAGGDRARKHTIEQRLKTHPRGLLPGKAVLPREQLAAQFLACLKDQATTVIEAGTAADIPAAVAGFLRRTGGVPRLRMGADPRFSALSWEEAGLMQLEGPATPEDQAALSHAVAGVAETGTLVLASGAENPTSLAFLPEVHLVAVLRGSIVGSYEDAFDIVRSGVGKGAMPRALNLVSGASRTGDIGGRIVMGAHGPRTLCVIVYGAEDAT